MFGRRKPAPAPARRDESGCDHQDREDMRTFGRGGSAEHWRCRSCGYEYNGRTA